MQLKNVGKTNQVGEKKIVLEWMEELEDYERRKKNSNNKRGILQKLFKPRGCKILNLSC